VPKLTYNAQLVFESPEDERKIFRVLEAERDACNFCSKIRFGMEKPSIVKLHEAFYGKFRAEFPDIPSQVVIRAEQEILGSYKSVKSNRQKITAPIEKKRLAMRLDKRLYDFKNGNLKLTTFEKRIKCAFRAYPKLEELLGLYRFCDPLLFVRKGEIFLALTFDIPEVPTKSTLAVGIDVGCRINAATSEGKLYRDAKFNGEKRALRYLKRKLQSSGSRSAKRHLKKLARKERNKNRNFSCHLANRILCETAADTIVLENLKSLKVKKTRWQNKNRVSQVPFYQLREILTHKAALYSEGGVRKPKTVIVVCPAYTSQDDSQTGKRDGIRKGRRYYAKNGAVYDADINAAINIAKRSKLPCSQCTALLMGQASVSKPIVKLA
jgi:IS605 OrfB family transposase